MKVKNGKGVERLGTRMLFVNGRNATVRERKSRAMNPFFLPNLIRGHLRLMKIEPELRYTHFTIKFIREIFILFPD